MPDQQFRQLSQVLNYIRGLVEQNLGGKKFWLKAEISNISFHVSGHCYLDLVENKEGRSIAQCKAMIWSSDLQLIRAELDQDFNNILKKGSEMLCLVEVTFSQIHGLSINIFRIDRSFALGELERRKQETYQRLRKEELLDKNKVHQLPVVVQRIALVGSPGTSGHTDFLMQLEKNEYKYRFYVRNFSCQVQGEKAESEIIQRLNELQVADFDIIVLIRGGGSKLDLEVFNSYNIARAIAFHSLPVLTGIGHESDISIADLVANQFFKTPSALGAFLVSRNHNYDNGVTKTYIAIRNLYQIYMQQEKHRIGQNSLSFENAAISYTRLRRAELHTVANRMSSVVNASLARQKQFHVLSKQVVSAATGSAIQTRTGRLNEISQLIRIHGGRLISSKSRQTDHRKELLEIYIKSRLKNENDLLTNAATLIQLYHPDNTLKRGYSITRIAGKLVDKETDLRVGETIEVELVDQMITATVVAKKLKDPQWKTLLTKLQQKS